MRKLTFIENSNFFARIEERDGGIWLVWGNPNQKNHNEARVNDSKSIILRDFLSQIISESNRSQRVERYQLEEPEDIEVLH